MLRLVAVAALLQVSHGVALCCKAADYARPQLFLPG